MEEKTTPIANNCSFAGIKPAMVELPYPPIQVKERNPVYANLLSLDYCGFRFGNDVDHTVHQQ